MKNILINRLLRTCLLHLSHVLLLSPAALLVAALFAGSVLAQPTITNLGTLTGAATPYSFAYAISADGTVVAGGSGTSSGERAFRWTAAGGMQNLGALAGYTARSIGSAISADGAVVTGSSYVPGLSSARAFRWTAATGMQNLGVLGTGSASYGTAASGDGSIIVGGSYTSGFTDVTPYRWTAATGMQSLNLPNDNAWAISAGGSVIVGTGYSDGFYLALRWTAAGGRQLLGLPNGADSGEGYATSADGSVVAGTVSDQLNGTFAHAFRWSGLGAGGSATMQDLGALDGSDSAYAYAISGDGSVIGGTCLLPLGARAFLWTATLGMVDLNHYLPARGVSLTGWTLEEARGISADGSAIVGYGTFNGGTRAFLVRGLTGLNAQASGTPLLTTFTNPSPASSDLFGTAVAALGNDRVLVGAEGTGAAYLFSSTGTLLTTFTNPTPSVANKFGVSLAAVETDAVVVGAYQEDTGAAQAGAAYLFGTNGTLLTTFTNPSPVGGDWFGLSLAAVGNDRVIIGASDYSRVHDGGAAYLFNTNGALLTSFSNPGPSADDAFGWSVAALGTDRVVIGARFGNSGSGVAYLYSTSGALLTTLPNPAPTAAENFGVSVASVGSDRLLIGAIDYAVGRSGGAAYLFSTNGTLLTTFTNPTPATFDYFGWSVAAVGSSRVLIGSYQDYAGEARSGTAHLFSTNGALLNTFTNPTPAIADNFGVSVAAVGTDRIIIGALGDDTGDTDSGAVYLFDLPYPSLSIARKDDFISFSWITSETGLQLQQTGALTTPTAWSDVTQSVFSKDRTNVVIQPIDSFASHRFYRLRRL